MINRDHPIEIKQPTILLVEGKDELRFFQALIKYLGIRTIQVIDIEGKTKLPDKLESLKIAPNFSAVRSLGIVRDADNDPHAAFQSVCNTLKAAGLPAPDRPLVSAGGKPSVTIMILPDNTTPGMLEDICLKAVATDGAMKCVDQYFACLKQQASSFPRNLAKAKIQVFLASREEAGKRLGEAAEAGYWPWDSHVFDQLKNFLQQIMQQ